MVQRLLLALLSSVCFAQTVINVRPMERADAVAPTFGQYVSTGDLPNPDARSENGKYKARLTLRGDNAAAWMLTFRSLNLPQGAQMFVYGSDAFGNVVSLHGPWEANGPLNVPDFATDPVAGAVVTIEILSRDAIAQWPFDLESVEMIDAARLAELRQGGLEVRPVVKPVVRVDNPNPDIRTTWLGDRLVQYEVVDGRGILEGDVDLGPVEQIVPAPSSKSDAKQAHITTITSSYWTGGVVPFRVRRSGTAAISVGSTLDQRITAAVNYWNGIFPGILKAYSNDANFVTVEFQSGGCASNQVGMSGGEQLIQVDNSCSSGNLIHEFGHVLGLYHEQSRPDRNSFVQINWGNVQAGKAAQFQIPSNSAGSGAYDFGSVMHYPLNAFSSNGQNTITPLVAVPAGTIIGQRSGLSAIDQTAIRNIYCSWSSFKRPANVIVGPEATGGSFSFYAPPYCSWTVQTNTPWIHIKSVLSGTGSGSVSFTVDPYNTRYQRTGSIGFGPAGTVITQQGTLWGTNPHVPGYNDLP